MLEEISPEELQTRLASAEAPLVLDVREPYELESARLPGTTDIPMNQVPQRLAELDPARPLVVLCRSGGRSRNVANFLLQHGFQNVANLSGGLLAWAERIDPSLRP